MSERIKIGFWNRIKQEILWLRGEIPEKFGQITGGAVIFIAWFFYFETEDAMKRPGLTVLGCLAGCWIGHEAAAYMAKFIKKKQ